MQTKMTGQTGDVQADSSLPWAHISDVIFSHVAVYIRAKLIPFIRPQGYKTFFHAQLS